MSNRRGYSLIELLVVIGVSAALMALIVLLISTLLRLDRSGGALAAERDTAARLASLFRADVHAATAVHQARATGAAASDKMGAGGDPAANKPSADRKATETTRSPAAGAGRDVVEPELILEISTERSVRYAAKSGELLRVVLERGALKQQEAFRLPQRGVARFQIEMRDGQQFVVMTLEGMPSPHRERRPRSLTIEAACGRDHRFERGGEP